MRKKADEIKAHKLIKRGLTDGHREKSLFCNFHLAGFQHMCNKRYNKHKGNADYDEANDECYAQCDKHVQTG
jgi:hypothetical protein